MNKVRFDMPTDMHINAPLKVMIRIKDGEPIRNDAVYKRSEWLTIDYESSGHDFSPIRELFHWYEIPYKNSATHNNEAEEHRKIYSTEKWEVIE